MVALSSYYLDPNGARFPDAFGATVYDFNKNEYSEQKVILGRALFYDPILSKDSTISCSSCHSPFNAFAHTDHPLSHGIGDSIGTRNAPSLFNLAWQKSFMWDGAINHLDMQALAPITHQGEMAEEIGNVINKLKTKSLYSDLFAQAYGDSLINSERMLKAMSQFQLSLVSADSKYDRVIAKIDTFTAQEMNGYQLFKANCSSCHTEPLFTNHQFKNNGLPIDSSLLDYGHGVITLLPQDSLRFKVPSLRNLKYTYPYMHDGRFKKLYQVIKHYKNLDHQSKIKDTDVASPISLNNNERVDLVAFLLTLNDESFVFNKDNRFPQILLQN